MSTVKVVFTKKRPAYKAWRCGTCGKLLGLLYPEGTLVIKYKDLDCWIEGKCKVICRFCKTSNEIRTDVKLEEFVNEEAP